MVIYTCNICDKIFTNKTDYIRHINRKYTCKKNIISNNINKDKIHICLYCKKKYAYKQSKYRHQLICKDKIKKNDLRIK